MFDFSFSGLRRNSPETQSNKPSVNEKITFFAASIAVLVLLVIGQQLTLLSRSQFIETDAIARSQESESISEILQLVENENFFEVFGLEFSIEANQSNNTILQELWDEFLLKVQL